MLVLTCPRTWGLILSHQPNTAQSAEELGNRKGVFFAGEQYRWRSQEKVYLEVTRHLHTGPYLATKKLHGLSPTLRRNHIMKGAVDQANVWSVFEEANICDRSDF